MPPERYDLHAHTVASDGLLAAREVVALAVDRGLCGVAITDHDTVAGVAQGVAAAAALGIDCIPGIELSCSDEAGADIHVLGYYIDPSARVLAATIEQMVTARHERVDAMVRRLQELGVTISRADVEGQARGESIGRPHVARALVACGAVADVSEAFGVDWLGVGGRAYVPRARLAVADAIRVIHAAGGAAVFAHPGVWRGSGVGFPDAQIRQAAAAGLDGIEVDHPDHDDAALRASAALAVELGLVQTAGSDDHGAGVDGPRLGCRTVPRGVVDELRLRAMSRQ